MIPREKRYPGILFELKWEKNLEEEDLNLLAEEALQQITTLKYDADMREDGITDILRFGIAFSGKKVRVKTIIQGIKEKTLVSADKGVPLKCWFWRFFVCAF